MKFFLLLFAFLPLNAADLLVAAASDLAPLKAALQTATGQRVTVVLGASGSLKQQIHNGAPFDVFLSANEQYIKDLAVSGEIVPDSVEVYATGRIAVWSSSGRWKTLHNLTNSEVRKIAIANPASAPYGAAAQQALEKQGLWKALQPKIVYAENIRQALQFAESKNADAAIVSWTLAHNIGGVLIPPELHSPIRQAGGIVAASKNQAAAREFLKYLVSAAGRELLKSHGL